MGGEPQEILGAAAPVPVWQVLLNRASELDSRGKLLEPVTWGQLADEYRALAQELHPG